MHIKELKNREVRASLSILLGLVLGVFYITANLLFCMFYTAVWYLALALYNACLLVCRYYSFDLYRNGQAADKISRVLTLASALMSVAILYSTFSGDFRLRSLSVIFISGIYTVFSFFRLLCSSLLFRERNTPICSVLQRLRILSFVSSLHAFFIQMVHIGGLSSFAKNILSFLSAFFSSYLLLTAMPRIPKGKSQAKNKFRK